MKYHNIIIFLKAFIVVDKIPKFVNRIVEGTG